MKAPKLLVFDSGMGGVSILQEVYQHYPHCQYAYVADNAFLPYGNQPEEVLLTRIVQVLQQVYRDFRADVIIIACNTASTLALPHLRACFDVPIIGVVPAIKPAAKLSLSKVIGVLATPATVKRHYTQQLMQAFASDCQVILLGSSELVQLAEEKLLFRQSVNQAIVPSVAAFTTQSSMDTVVLACTHFPLLKEELADALPNVVHWVDSSKAIAKRVGHWLTQLQLPHSRHTGTAAGTAYFSAKPCQQEQLRQVLLAFNITTIKAIATT